MASFEQIDRARRLLGLLDSASMQQIKTAYRRKAHRHHPDKDSGQEEGGVEMKDLNWAYELLMDYCSQYKFTFSREDVARAYPEDEYHRRYTYGWFGDT